MGLTVLTSALSVHRRNLRPRSGDAQMKASRHAWPPDFAGDGLSRSPMEHWSRTLSLILTDGRGMPNPGIGGSLRASLQLVYGPPIPTGSTKSGVYTTSRVSSWTTLASSGVEIFATTSTLRSGSETRHNLRILWSSDRKSNSSIL